MTDEKAFECRNCGKKARATEAPECCGMKMALVLPPCTHAYGPEHSRPMDDEEPCDDSRGG